MYEDKKEAVYATTGEMIMDSQTGLCYKRFYMPSRLVPEKSGKSEKKKGIYPYEPQWRLTECDSRMFSVGQISIRLPKALEIPTPLFPIRKHSQIERNLFEGGFGEFPKELVKVWITGAKRLRSKFLARNNFIKTEHNQNNALTGGDVRIHRYKDFE